MRGSLSVFAASACLAAALLGACGGSPIARRAAEGDASAQFEYGRRLLTGQHGLRQDPAAAVPWLRASADQGHSSAQAALGVCCELGLGVPSSLSEARNWYALASRNGNPFATLALAQLERRGDHPERALPLLRRAADAGLLSARLQLAEMLMLGDGVDQRLRDGIDQLRLAAMDGSGEAAYLMGLCYATGLGVPVHSGIALGWIRNAADLGYRPARKLLAELRAEFGEVAEGAAKRKAPAAG